MAWVRIGPGQYKDDKTGKIIRGQATDPNKNPRYNKPATANKPVGPSTTTATTQPGPAMQNLAKVGVPAQSITPENFIPERQRLEQTSYANITRDYDKRRLAQKQQLEQDLYNRGYRPDQTSTTGAGSWNDMTSTFESGWQDAYAKAAAESQRLGGEEFDRMFGANQAAIDTQGGLAYQQGQLRESAADRASRERIARMQLARRGAAAGPAKPQQPDIGYDII